MDFWLDALLAFVLGMAFLVVLIGTNVHGLGAGSKALAECRRQAIVQFTEWQATSAAARLRLGAGQCEVVQESETVGSHRAGVIYSYTLTRFMRNPAGDYFLFMSTPTGPYVKPVTPVIAKVVLKDRFVEPGARGGTVGEP